MTRVTCQSNCMTTRVDARRALIPAITEGLRKYLLVPAIKQIRDVLYIHRILNMYLLNILL